MRMRGCHHVTAWRKKRERGKDGESRTKWPGLEKEHNFCSLAVFRVSTEREGKGGKYGRGNLQIVQQKGNRERWKYLEPKVAYTKPPSTHCCEDGPEFTQCNSFNASRCRTNNI